MHHCVKVEESGEEHDLPEQGQQGHENEVELDEGREELEQDVSSLVLIVNGCCLLLARLCVAAVAELLLQLAIKLVPVVEDAHLLDHQKQAVHENERVAAYVEAEPLVLVSLAVGLQQDRFVRAFAGDGVHMIEQRGDSVPGESGYTDACQVILNNAPVVARVDQRGHQNKGHAREQSPRPAELDKVNVEHVVLLGEVVTRADDIEVLEDGADEQGAHVDAHLDVNGREDESLENEQQAHEEKVAWRARCELNVLSAFHGQRRRCRLLLHSQRDDF